MKTALKSAFSASLSWLKPDCLRQERTATPSFLRCLGSDTACSKAAPENLSHKAYFMFLLDHFQQAFNIFSNSEIIS